jgi:rubrerythrin
MFTKEDFVDYFSEVEQFERNMSDLYDEGSKMVRDPKIKKLFQEFAKAEDRQAHLIDNMRHLAIRASLKE